jgi:hypothetical protein
VGEPAEQVPVGFAGVEQGTDAVVAEAVHPERHTLHRSRTRRRRAGPDRPSRKNVRTVWTAITNAATQDPCQQHPTPCARRRPTVGGTTI